MDTGSGPGRYLLPFDDVKWLYIEVSPKSLFDTCSFFVARKPCGCSVTGTRLPGDRLGDPLTPGRGLMTCQTNAGKVAILSQFPSYIGLGIGIDM